MVHQKVTMNGMENSSTKPWNSETTAYCLPDESMMTGNVVSIEVTPPAAIGANGPATFTSSGDSSSVIISRTMFDSNAMLGWAIHNLSLSN